MEDEVKRCFYKCCAKNIVGSCMPRLSRFHDVQFSDLSKSYYVLSFSDMTGCDNDVCASRFACTCFCKLCNHLPWASLGLVKLLIRLEQHTNLGRYLNSTVFLRAGLVFFIEA